MNTSFLNRKARHFKLFFLIVLLYSCSSDSDEDTFLSSNKSLFSFSIKELPDLTFSGLSQGQLEADLISNANITNLTAIFEVSKGATVYIGEIVQKSGSTTNDFSSRVTYTIKAEDGSTATFSVTINSYENQPPTANAGSDMILYLPVASETISVALDASASSDPEDEEMSYEWTLDDAIIADTEMAEVALALGIHEITLVVTDAEGASGTDNITVEIRELGVFAPIDSGATQQTQNVLNNLAALAYGETFAFGQEFPLSFQLNALNYDLNTSDCKDVSGDHPAVFGIDPHYMLYKSASERQLHIDETKAAYENGSIVTFDFHQQSRTDGQIYYDQLTTDTDKSLMFDIVNDLNDSRDWYFDEIDIILDIINNDLGFTIIFRPLHEMNGGWFWWGTQTENHSPELYIELYQMTVDYMKERTDHVLFAWSPNYPFDEGYYPGDAYVDIVGIDYYTPSKASLQQALIELTDFAEQHHKIAALTETGQQNYIFDNTDFWTDNILNAIEEGGSDIRIAWVLGWFNAPWDSSQNNLFIPNAQSPQDAKDDFIAFKNSSKTLFQEDMQVLDMYQDPSMN
ncbi:Glycosyl hydrolase family 26 [Flagellimonas taeanensis]|uniref:Glycosyl hydrolase family 26 n=1 Tax=Flagellimonas taeanensis TaxID=1005926 RepID=A0A1M6SDS4_9FLAO|nr:glycosyl hydrolase [Allomuricauda taeanensis]SFB80168.1 Glycosyl hydrolase family 26 [Allomuricauda taeanensis]SHK42809.1 Glycosyl hydrolase family 26 [Allomuricauda taeanensis]